MARRTRTRKSNRNKSKCRSCGDQALIDPDTFEPTGLCAACSAPKVRAARKQAAVDRRADRDAVVVKPKSEPSGPANGPYHVVQTYRGEVWVNADGEPL